MFNRSEEPKHDNPNHSGLRSHLRNSEIDYGDIEEMPLTARQKVEMESASARLKQKAKSPKAPLED